MYEALKFSVAVIRKTRINSMRNVVTMPLHSEEELSGMITTFRILFIRVFLINERINSMRNVVIMPLHSEEELVIATDNHGSIGEKAQDAIHISNKAVGYSACRVAMMELLAVGGKPLTIVMQNFTGDAAWEDYKSGAQRSEERR